MRLSKKESIIATVCYGDVFDFPLTRKELALWMLFRGNTPSGSVKDIEQKSGYVYLKGRKKIVVLRQKKYIWQRQKHALAQRAADILSQIPTITLVGITGGLAMDNARRSDDIDLFCIASGGTLWISRFLATVLLEFAGLRRHPNQRHVADKICLNMFMSDNALQIPIEEQDCFAAHEVLQMKPIWGTRGAYRKFLSANRWVKKFLPNAWEEKNRGAKNRNYGKSLDSHSAIRTTMTMMLRLFEFPVKVAQLGYMKNHRTKEIVTDTLIRFHPRDARVWIKKKLGMRLRLYTIPLDKIFYGG